MRSPSGRTRNSGWAPGGEGLGPLAAAALHALIDVRGVLPIGAATFVVSALLLTCLPRADTRPRPERGSLLGDARDGLRYIASTGWYGP